jgi:excisionase family DNA binding protein
MQTTKSKEMEVMKIMEKTTMSVQELSSQMGISLPKAYELVKTPGFPSIRIGTRILIPIDAFREWLVITSNKEE